MADKPIVFGLATYKNAIQGLHLQSVSYSESSSTAEATDESGNIEQIDVFAKKRSIQCSGNVLADGDLSALTVGAELTVDGITYIIDTINVTEGVNAHKTASITASAPIAAEEESGT